jgi:DNA-binding LytR/AlgR family response regulator
MDVVIIEDERLSAQRLELMLQELSSDLRVVSRLSSVKQSIEWFATHSLPDLIFMDIQLNDGLSFEILDHIKGEPPVIFTTAYDEYAIRAFKFKSVDYLLKPIDQDELVLALQKYSRHHQSGYGPYSEISKMFSRDYRQRFLIKVGEQYVPVKTNEIAYFYFDNGMTYLRTFQQKRFPMDHSLERLMEMVDPLEFFRINRKLIVALNSVKQIHGYFNSRLLLKIEPEFEDEVIVSRERVNDFKGWIGT